MKGRPLALLLICLAQGVTAQQRGAARFPTTLLQIRSDSGVMVLEVELALTDDQQALGLQDRDRLEPYAGMWFRLREPIAANTPAITMYRTRIPLDIAFLDSAGTILDIVTMQPCRLANRSDCTRYRSAKAFQGALEINAGLFARHGIRVGHRISRLPSETCYAWSVPQQRPAWDTAGAWLILQDTITIADWKRAWLHGPGLATTGWQESTWREHTPDSIRVVMNSTFVNMVFTLARTSALLAGRLDYASDVMIRDSTGATRRFREITGAEARPQPCPLGMRKRSR